jgi:hypothetical protein
MRKKLIRVGGEGGEGRRGRKIRWPQGCVGSTPSARTTVFFRLSFPWKKETAPLDGSA